MRPATADPARDPLALLSKISKVVPGHNIAAFLVMIFCKGTTKNGAHMFETCTETVSILYAIAFGAGDACVEIGMASLAGAFVAFMVGVVILQFFARKLWKRVSNPAPPPPERRIGTIMDDTIADDPNYQDSAIRSSKR